MFAFSFRIIVKQGLDRYETICQEIPGEILETSCVCHFDQYFQIFGKKHAHAVLNWISIREARF